MGTKPFAAEQLEVTVDGEVCKVWVAQKSKSVWIAYGDFRGERINQNGSSQNNALENWYSAADYKSRE